MSTSTELSAAELQHITVNGEQRHLPTGIHITDLLRQVGLDPEQARGIAVAVNDEVIPRGEWAEHAINAGDRIEIVTAKQGG